jgi:hypothetical protein
MDGRGGDRHDDGHDCAARDIGSVDDANAGVHRARRAQAWFPALLATAMSAFVALVVTAINTGVDVGLAGRWWHAWTLALPAAIVAAYAFRPLAWRLASVLARFGDRAPRR